MAYYRINGGINVLINVRSGHLDTSLVDKNIDGFNSKNKVGEDIECNEASSDEQESESEHFLENGKRKNAVDTCADKVVKDAENHKKAVAKPDEKRSAACSQLQTMSQLVASIKRLAEVNARKLMIEQKDRKSLLEFRREEAVKRENTKNGWSSFT